MIAGNSTVWWLTSKDISKLRIEDPFVGMTHQGPDKFGEHFHAMISSCSPSNLVCVYGNKNGRAIMTNWIKMQSWWYRPQYSEIYTRWTHVKHMLQFLFQQMARVDALFETDVIWYAKHINQGFCNSTTAVWSLTCTLRQQWASQPSSGSYQTFGITKTCTVAYTIFSFKIICVFWMYYNSYRIHQFILHPFINGHCLFYWKQLLHC